MHTKVTSLILFVLLFALGSTVLAQGPVPIVTPTYIDSAVYNGIYRGHQSQIFCEPTTGNLIVAWYRYYSGQPNPRRITAAVSTDGGQTWTIYENINQGVGTEMNARYASVWGTTTTPLIVYADRNPEGPDQDSRPVLAYDVLGWGGGLFDNIMIDNSGSADTVLYSRYNSISVAPDNPNLMAVGSYHNAAPGEGLYCYISTDGGFNWSAPHVVASAVPADSGAPNWVHDLSSSGLGVTCGPNNELMAVGLAKIQKDDMWRLIYSHSSDGGQTWSAISGIPGSESLTFQNSDVYRNFSNPILDNAGNWHIFGLGFDTTLAHTSSGVPGDQPYRAYDLRFDGTTWSINEFVLPQLLVNGLAAWGDLPPDLERHPMNDPAIGPDGTLYYCYSDVVDTTGSHGDPKLFNFNMFIVFSEDNGDTWQGPVSVLDHWVGQSPNGMARIATDKLHIVYRKECDPHTDQLYYMGVPTDTVKSIVGIQPPLTRIMPEKFNLHQNYPNPFNPTTTIRFDLTRDAHVTLTIYNALGQEVTTLVNQRMTAGFKAVVWDASQMPSGTYFYTLKAGDFTATRKMLLVK